MRVHVGPPTARTLRTGAEGNPAFGPALAIAPGCHNDPRERVDAIAVSVAVAVYACRDQLAGTSWHGSRTSIP